MIRSVPAKFIYLFSIIALMMIIYSCSDDVVVKSDMSHDLSYFPTDSGYWIEYHADSIVHLDADDQNLVDTSILAFHFQVREEIDSSFIDSENQKAFVVLRYRRDTDSLPWTLTSVWTAKISSYSAERVEDNIRYIRLGFPISSSKTWNGNAYNFYPEEDYSYDNLYENRQYGTLSFDSSITVLQNNFVSHINRIYKKEIYAPRVGMLYKEMDSLTTTETSNGTIILDGLEYKLSITGYKH